MISNAMKTNVVIIEKFAVNILSTVKFTFFFTFLFLVDREGHDCPSFVGCKTEADCNENECCNDKKICGISISVILIEVL